MPSCGRMQKATSKCRCKSADPNSLRKTSFSERVPLPQRLKPDEENAVIAAVNRCATQNRFMARSTAASQRSISPQSCCTLSYNLRVGSPIQCTNLRKTYDGKVEAVRGLSLHIEAGECFGLLGPNGAGKTTTIEILEGLLAPTSGEVRIFGHTWND